jgi:acetamidase/formamidase
VRIKAVELHDDWGYNLIRPGMGGLPEDFTQERVIFIALDAQRMVGRLPWGADIPLRPFFGVMGVAPSPAAGTVSSVPPGHHGGNIDNKELGAGATLYLPVHVDGALFSVGDGHGVQGDGEVCLTAIETGLIGTFELHLHKDRTLEWPYAETPTHLITMAFDPDLDVCVTIALREMIAAICAHRTVARGRLYAVQPRRRPADHANRQRQQGRACHAGQPLFAAARVTQSVPPFVRENTRNIKHDRK